MVQNSLQHIEGLYYGQAYSFFISIVINDLITEYFHRHHLSLQESATFTSILLLLDTFSVTQIQILSFSLSNSIASRMDELGLILLVSQSENGLLR